MQNRLATRQARVLLAARKVRPCPVTIVSGLRHCGSWCPWPDSFAEEQRSRLGLVRLASLRSGGSERRAG